MRRVAPNRTLHVRIPYMSELVAEHIMIVVAITR